MSRIHGAKVGMGVMGRAFTSPVPITRRATRLHPAKRGKNLHSWPCTCALSTRRASIEMPVSLIADEDHSQTPLPSASPPDKSDSPDARPAPDDWRRMAWSCIPVAGRKKISPPTHAHAGTGMYDSVRDIPGRPPSKVRIHTYVLRCR